jgi:radical SAM-linked protein
LALRYAIGGDLRFISHQDTLRMFRRAFARADLPLRHSEGFNPHPKLSIVLPRPVGVASDAELLVAELESEIQDLQSFEDRLAAQLPQGARCLSTATMDDRDRIVVEAATYRVPLEDCDRSRVGAAVCEFLASKVWQIERTHPKRGTRRLDIRGFVTDVTVGDDQVEWRQDVSQDGTARVNEVLSALSIPAEEHLHQVVRAHVAYRS